MTAKIENMIQHEPEYLCPYNRSPLEIVESGSAAAGGRVYANESGDEYPIVDGIPHFYLRDKLTNDEQAAVNEYDQTVSYYDAHIDWLFASFYEEEDRIRNAMVDLLEISPSSRILEVAAGTGRDTCYIAARLNDRGTLYVQDIAATMVQAAQARLEAGKYGCGLRFFVSSASHLPFADGFFDAVYTFGGFNEFTDPAASLRELARVVKPGGKVVFGDEHVAPWLEDTEYAEVIKTNNPIFRRTSLPLAFLPVNSRFVCVRWIIGGCFYVIDFKVGEGIPPLNLDLPHKGWRGGSLRTRFFGQLEGVNPETRKRVIAAAKGSGKSVYQWLDDTLNRAVEAQEAEIYQGRDTV
jgi:ubiquinone/menaquinone biosynthesis C-methylase UbiE